jgi:hypothetical protein
VCPINYPTSLSGFNNKLDMKSLSHVSAISTLKNQFPVFLSLGENAYRLDKPPFLIALLPPGEKAYVLENTPLQLPMALATCIFNYNSLENTPKLSKHKYAMNDSLNVSVPKMEKWNRLMMGEMH